MASRRNARRARNAVVNATRSGNEDPSSPAAGAAQNDADRSAAGATGSRPAGTARGAGRAGASSRRGRGDEGGGHRPAIDRDGKASIACPNCAARYKILEASLEAKVQCTQCHRTFYPLAAAGGRRQRPDNSKPIIYGAVGVVAIILIGVVINSVTTPPPKDPDTTVKKAAVVDLTNTQEVRSVITWAKAVGDRDRFNAVAHTDLDALQKLFAIDTKNLHSRSFGPAKTEVEGKIIEALFAADRALVFRFYQPTYGKVEDAAMLGKRAGTVELNLYPRDSKIHKESARVRVHYTLDDRDTLRVKGWDVVTMARAEYLAEAIDGKKKNSHKAHDLIGKAKSREISFAGKKYVIEEADLVPLPHLASTSPEDRKKIDGLIETLLDLNVSGIERNRASEALILIKKPAIPRLLNKMYEIKMKTQEDIITVNLLCRTLRLSTGERFGFNPRDHQGQDLGGSEEERISALKQWYAWWGRYHDRDDWKNEDRDDEVELTTEQIDAKRKAEREAARKEREARNKRIRGK